MSVIGYARVKVLKFREIVVVESKERASSLEIFETRAVCIRTRDHEHETIFLHSPNIL